MGVMRDMPLQKYVHDALICLHSGDGNSDAKLRIAEALAGYRRPAASPRWRPNERITRTQTMDFALSNEQRPWQMTARKFAEEEIRPISLERDEIADPRETFDWEIIKKGSKLGFRTMAVPKEWGGQGTDFVTQALVMAELAQGDSAISKTFSQNWKWSHLIAAACTRRAEGALPQTVPRRRHVPPGQGHHRAERRIRQPPAAGGRSQGRPQAARRAPRRRMDPQRREMLHRQRAASASCSSSTRAPIRMCRCARAAPCSWCRATRRASASARCSTRAAGDSTRTAR